MQVSSGLPLPTDNFPSVSLPESGRLTQACVLDDEEFPADLPTDYDWTLQPTSRCADRRIARFVVVLLAVLLLAISIFVFHKLSNPSPSALTSPVAPLL